MLLIQKLEYMDNLTPNEELVAKYILKNQNNISRLSTTDISQNTYTSPSTTVRLAQKLGYAGWKELKEAFIDELNYLNNDFQTVNPNIPFKENDNIQTVCQNITHLLADSIYDTYHLLQHDSLQKATQLLYQSDIINVYGISHAIGGSHDFKWKMRSIGKIVNIIDNPEEFPYYLKLTKNNTCSIFVSYSGETEMLLSLVKKLNLQNHCTIAITSIGDNSLSQLCDCWLPISTRERLYSKIASYSSNISIFYIFDILYSTVFLKDYKKNWNDNIEMHKDIDQDRHTYVSIIKETEL